VEQREGGFEPVPSGIDGVDFMLVQMGRVRERMGQRPRPKLHSGPKRGRSVTIPSVLLCLSCLDSVDSPRLDLSRFECSAASREVTKVG
jgi:hypothetical protein